MKTKNILSVATIILFFLNSCSKENDKEVLDTTRDYGKNLVDKNYIMVSSTSVPAYPIGNGVYSSDIYTDYYKDDCVLDDLKMFKTNGDYIVDNGATKCHADEIQTNVSKWRFIQNNTVIQIFSLYNASIKDLKILIIDGNTLKYEMKVNSITNNITTIHTFTETWKKI